MAAAAQAAASREAAARKKAAQSQNMWQVAQQAEAEGDVQVAARMYRRIATRQPPTDLNKAASARLGAIRAEALERFESLASDLTGQKESDESDQDSQGNEPRRPAALKRVQTNPKVVRDAFKKMDDLATEFAGVVTVEEELVDRIEKLRKEPRYAKILLEPDAAELVRFGRDYEEKGHLCCAMLVYEEAAAMTPAPSAEWAKTRFKEMQADSGLVAAAQECRRLQWCHAYFQRAQAIMPYRKEKAIEYFARICELAPAESPVHQASREHLAKLR